ncbi:hypothetical protein QOZ80_5AG0390620 [Eleusine coracana subsp. coracana]|nr:hypothetical protein QOZ80_5AG0390620 [Eleusine coracana subsp. coracana]
MMDPVGGVERIVKLALTLKDAADTVRQNKELCLEIRTRAVRVSSLLSLLPAESTVALMDEPAMRGALEDLEESLRRALELVAACQAERSTAACLLLLCTAGKQSRRLRKAQDDISQNVMTVIFATNVQVTVILTRNNPPPPPPHPLTVVELSGPPDTVAAYESPMRAGGRRIHIRYDDMVAADEEDDDISQAMFVQHEDTDTMIRDEGLTVPDLCWEEDESGFYSRDERLSFSASFIECGEYVDSDNIEQPSPLSSGFIKFDLSELDDATRHFSDDNLIGRGTFAAVYKGELPDGLVVAVKKFQHPLQISMTLIHDQINLCSEFQQKNVVKFLGYAVEEGNYFLVEEYMSRGNLNNIIASPPSWVSLFQIIRRTARGLHYLHNQHFIHLDLKPNNILLDSHMNPKITIGTATILGQGDDITQDAGTIASTLGYMAPEYIMGGTLSTKCDVYGFGVILLEIISSMCKSEPTRGQASIE